MTGKDRNLCLHSSPTWGSYPVPTPLRRVSSGRVPRRVVTVRRGVTPGPLLGKEHPPKNLSHLHVLDTWPSTRKERTRREGAKGGRGDTRDPERLTQKVSQTWAD